MNLANNIKKYTTNALNRKTAFLFGKSMYNEIINIKNIRQIFARALKEHKIKTIDASPPINAAYSKRSFFSLMLKKRAVAQNAAASRKKLTKYKISI